MALKILFLGTPKIACPFLKSLLDLNVEIKGVITQTDKESGRGMKLVCPPIKVLSQEINLPVFQPSNNKELKEIIIKLNADLAIVVAYGKIIKKEILDLLPLGFINVHFSLLPKHRGAAPVRKAIMEGENKTGITIFKLNEGMDSGPILLKEEIKIEENDDAFSLFEKLEVLGIKVLRESVNLIISNKAEYKNQEGEPSYSSKIKTMDTFLSFKNDIKKNYNLIRAFSFPPRARFKLFNGLTIQIIKSSISHRNFEGEKNGSIVDFEKGKGIFIKCDKGALFLETIMPEGKKNINAYDYFINGMKLKKGDIISNE